VKVYPNPANEFVTVTSASNLSAIRVIDLSGREVRSYNLLSGKREFQFSVAALPEGLYFLEALTDDGGKGVQRLVVQR
jgi:hypothetical protein